MSIHACPFHTLSCFNKANVPFKDNVLNKLSSILKRRYDEILTLDYLSLLVNEKSFPPT